MSTLAINQDPLVSAYANLPLQPQTEESASQVIGDMAKLVSETRAIPRNNLMLSNSSDPILQSVHSFLQERRYHLTWNHILFIGCSAGGDKAFRELMSHVIMPHIPIVFVMHHNPGFQFMTKIEMKNGVFQRPITAKDGEPIRSDSIYFLAGDKTYGFRKTTKSFSVTPLLREMRFRPDIDSIFKQAATSFKEMAMGIIMSGMLNDGAEGIQAMGLNRAETWIQDPSTALFSAMPEAAKEKAPFAKIGSIKKIADRINLLSRQSLKIEPIVNMLTRFSLRRPQ